MNEIPLELFMKIVVPQMQQWTTIKYYFSYQLVNKHWSNMLRNEVVEHSEFYLDLPGRYTDVNLSKFTKVKVLMLDRCELFNINFEYLANVKRLDLSYNSWKGVNTLKLLINVEYLNIAFSGMNYSHLLDLPNLKVLIIGNVDSDKNLL